MEKMLQPTFLRGWLNARSAVLRLLLAGSWQLAKTKRGKELYLAYEVVGGGLKLEIREGKAPDGNVSRGNGVCLKCGAHIPNDEVVKQIRENEKERMLAVVLLNSGSGKTTNS